MNRNMKLGIAVLMVALFVGLTYGAVVTYLSNQVTTDITVTSPMLVGVSSPGRDSWDTTYCWRSDTSEWVLSFPEGTGYDGYISDWSPSDWETSETTLIISDVQGGETVTLYTMSANLADAEITAHEEIIISNPSGITGDDFVSITARFDSIYGDLGYGGTNEELSGWYAITPYKIELWPTTDTSTWGAGETDVAMWNITFKPEAFGTYTISYRVVPAP